MVSGGCLISGSTVRRSLLFSNVRVHSYCHDRGRGGAARASQIGRHCVLKRVVIDRGCRLAPGTEIGVDPVADRKRFHVSDKGSCS